MEELRLNAAILHAGIYVFTSAIALPIETLAGWKSSRDRGWETGRLTGDGNASAWRGSRRVAPYVPLFSLDDFVKCGELANFVFILPLDDDGKPPSDKSPLPSLRATLLFLLCSVIL
jgi:hypothetical protein